MASSTMKSADDRRKEVMVGELPGDFLRLAPIAREQQLEADEQAAVALQQQLGGSFAPANTCGKLTVTIIEAKLTKNYGVTRMDPYVRLRLGHIVYETPTDYNGAKNPKWNKVFHCMLPAGITSITFEIYDECAFTLDEKIAWTTYAIPEAVFKGETFEEMIPLSGKQGEGKEGFLSIVFSYSAYPAVYPQPVMVVPTTYYPVVPGMMPYYTPAAYPQYPQGQMPVRTPITENDIKQLKEMFPGLDKDVIQSVLESNQGDKDRAITSLLQMSGES